MSSKTVTVKVGPGPMFLLFLVFLVLKLTDTIDWSWWWITSPLWIPLSVGILLWVVGKALIGLSHVLESKEERKRREAREALLEYKRSKHW